VGGIVEVLANIYPAITPGKCFIVDVNRRRILAWKSSSQALYTGVQLWKSLFQSESVAILVERIDFVAFGFDEVDIAYARKVHAHERERREFLLMALSIAPIGDRFPSAIVIVSRSEFMGVLNNLNFLPA